MPIEECVKLCQTYFPKSLPGDCLSFCKEFIAHNKSPSILSSILPNHFVEHPSTLVYVSGFTALTAVALACLDSYYANKERDLANVIDNIRQSRVNWEKIDKERWQYNNKSYYAAKAGNFAAIFSVIALTSYFFI